MENIRNFEDFINEERGMAFRKSKKKKQFSREDRRSAFLDMINKKKKKKNESLELNEEDPDLGMELAYKLKTLPDDSTFTVDDFCDEFGIREHMTGFGWAAILKNASPFLDMDNDEFFKIYSEYKK